MRLRRLSFFGLPVLLGLVWVGCLSSVDPNKGRYSCQTDADCGPSFECKVQALGNALCFKKGTCVAETCNGLDDDCNGAVDETFPSLDLACVTDKPGVCGPGKLSCVDAGESCVSQRAATAELCNGLDDNCNQLIDESFSLSSDGLNCGVCGRVCAAGTSCQLSVCREANCSDGIDNDFDGGVDCADPSCQQRSCFTGPDAGYVCGKLPDPPDAGFDAGLEPDAGLDGGELDSGFPDAGDPDAGSDAGRFFCFPAEQCDDAIDNDQDRLTDCADPDCNNLPCMGGTVCTNGICPGPG